MSYKVGDVVDYITLVGKRIPIQVQKVESDGAMAVIEVATGAYWYLSKKSALSHLRPTAEPPRWSLAQHDLEPIE